MNSRAFYYTTVMFHKDSAPGYTLRHHDRLRRQCRGPIMAAGNIIHVPHSGGLRYPFQFYFAVLEQQGLNLICIYDGLRRVDRNLEIEDHGVLLQFATVGDAVRYKLSR